MWLKVFSYFVHGLWPIIAHGLWPVHTVCVPVHTACGRSELDIAMELELESESDDMPELDLDSDDHADSESNEAQLVLDPDSDDDADSESNEAQLVLDPDSDDDAVMLPKAEVCFQRADSESSLAQLELDSDSNDDDAVGLPKAEVCFQWAFRLIAALEMICGTRVLRERLLGCQRFSSHFSGLGGAEVAVNFIQSAMRHQLWLRASWTLEHVCDKGRNQQRVLQARLQKQGCCIFTDIFHRVPDLRHFAVGHASDAVFSDMKATALAARVSHSGECLTHRNLCQAVHTDIDISGSPCQSWSAAGEQLRHNSPLVAVTLAWCAWLRAALVKLAIHENVLGFDVEMLRELLGDLYDTFPLTGG